MPSQTLSVTVNDHRHLPFSINFSKSLEFPHSLQSRRDCSIAQNSIPSCSLPRMPDISPKLPNDIVCPIFQDAARDTPTALSLALVSKPVAAIVEPVLYKSITLRSHCSIRAFAHTLQNKDQHIFSAVTQLILGLPTPSDCPNFWVLVDQQCPKLDRLSLLAVDLELVRHTQLHPRHLSVSFKHPIGLDEHEIVHSLPGYDPVTEPSPAPWSKVTHLTFLYQDPDVLTPFVRGCLRHLTHFSCFDSNSWIGSAFSALLAIPSMHLCMIGHRDTADGVEALLMGFILPKDFRVVLVWEAKEEDMNRWASAEKVVIGRMLQMYNDRVAHGRRS
ncbi:hypothetical protein FB45DRAFT_522185 [Roridomyces roridus]|uniref:Uncharacterized protein n=1 Tax=Roridomyces roridus TaxID=1738132 RepID=A0AAD7BYU6_9AGAR|nr:hypothetical protein FB45DRAFT_522185 [Roridomyces roridus]